MSSSLLKLTVRDSGRRAQQCSGQAQEKGGWVNWKPHTGNPLEASWPSCIVPAEDFFTSRVKSWATLVCSITLHNIIARGATSLTLKAISNKLSACI